MRCKTCQYSITGVTEHRCPECGTAFDPTEPASNSPLLRYWFRVACHTAIVSLVLSVAVFAFLFLTTYFTPDHRKPIHNTVEGAFAFAGTAVMAALIVLGPIIFVGALFTARRPR